MAFGKKRQQTKLKTFLDTVCEECDELQKYGFWPYSTRMGMSSMLWYELFRFCHYLSVSDHGISEAEAAFMQTVLNDKTSVEEMMEYVRDSHVYSSGFLNEIPLIIQGGVKAEQEANRALQGAGRVEIVEKLISCFEQVGREFVKADGLTKEEARDYNMYMRNLVGYLTQKQYTGISFREL